MIMKRNLTCTFSRRLTIAAALLALAFVAAPRPVRAQGSRKDDIVIGPRGTPLGGASVAICTQPAVTTTAPCSPLATLYSNAALTQALANPLTTDGLGNYVFYAAPGKYTIQIYGPNLTTRVLPDVILPSDPSAPTFSTLTTTSGITAFSLSLGGNLTVAGNSAVTGTLTVGGAPVPSTAQDLQWSSSQRFKGPIPYRDISAFGPPGGCPQVYYFAPPAGTIAASSHTLTISGGAYTATNGCGVAVYGAGPNSTLSTPGTISVSAHTYTGSTTYCYEVVAVDNNLGMSAASAHTCISNGVATLGRDSYNFLSWTGVSNAVAYVIYESATSGGTYTAVGTSYVAAYCDMGFATAPVPDFAPSTAPSAVTAQALFTTISSGGGTTTLTLAAAASNSAAGQPVYQDDSWMLTAAEATLNPNVDGFSPTLVIPPGLYWFPHNGAGNGQAIQVRGQVNLTALPLFIGGYQAYTGLPGAETNINVSHHVGAMMFVGGAPWIENIECPALYGDGIVFGIGTSQARLENVGLTEAANGAGSPIRLDGNVIVLYARNLFLSGNQTSGGPPDIWFNAETSSTNDSDIRISEVWMAFHSVKFDAPVGVINPFQLMTIDKVQTEENFDHGFIVVDNHNMYGVQIELTDIAQDTNYSNYVPDVLCIGGVNCNVVGTGINSAGTAPYSNSPGPLFGTWPNLAYPGVGGSATLGVISGAAGGAFYSPTGGTGWVAQGPSGTLLSNNLGVMETNGSAGDVQWGQVVTATGGITVGTITTGTGSLAAGTYYYVAACVNPDGGLSMPSPELSATLSATGEIQLNMFDTQAGCIGGLRFYRGTTSGGENVWLNKSSNYYTVGAGGLYATSWTDDGTYTSNSGAPPNRSTAFYSKLMEDYNSFSYLLADNPAIFHGQNTRLGIGTMTDPGSGSGIKLDVAGGTVRGQSGFVAGLSDPAFTNSPRGVYHAFLPALTSTATGATLTLDRGVTLTRVQAQAITAPSGCTTNAVVRVTDGTTPINVTVSAAANDSGALTQNYAAGAALTISVSTAAAGCSTSPANVNVEVQYRMQ